MLWFPLGDSILSPLLQWWSHIPNHAMMTQWICYLQATFPHRLCATCSATSWVSPTLPPSSPTHHTACAPCSGRVTLRDWSGGTVCSHPWQTPSGFGDHHSSWNVVVIILFIPIRQKWNSRCGCWNRPQCFTSMIPCFSQWLHYSKFGFIIICVDLVFLTVCML